MIDTTYQAEILSQALPFMQHYDGQIVVIKYGGHAMGDEKLSEDFARDIVLLRQSGLNPIVVHGGGPQIAQLLKRMSIVSEFKDGLRVTDKATVEVVEMVLAGAINKQIVSHITKQGGQAIGLCGKDANMVTARKLVRKQVDVDSHIEQIVDLGFVGEPKTVRPGILHRLISEKIIPVIAPVSADERGDTYNVNADTFAGAIAAAVGAKRFLLLTDVVGILDKDKKLIPHIDVKSAQRLIDDGTARGGMIPKIKTCVKVLNEGVEGAVIMDGKKPHAVLLELFTAHGAGTLIFNS